jgi:hypothetical protein
MSKVMAPAARSGRTLRGLIVAGALTLACSDSQGPAGGGNTKWWRGRIASTR